MRSSADHVPAGQSTSGPRTAQEALERVLELIRTSASIESFTADHVSPAMGQSVQHRDDGSGRFGASGVLTRDWNYGFGVNRTEVKGTWFEYLFLPNPPEASPSMSGICQLDFEAFAAHLEKMGFSRQRNLVEDGRWMSEIFQRPGMRVELFPRGKADEPLARTTRQCVEWVQVR
ncbi:hypothetical protein [Xanthomonas campestris]|uniref:hypothetical protein n=1 Tax=Xanthomonas campestris TaxID=339 RepID=UPI002B23819C|nr:hypothetical protein [Xanthomonas campestris]MEA9757446.1 hypothetical protein [Xanthomonas campestris pv. raphani]MEA9765640.1 hypothetical protein [Xanthomonas campestris pv. raphani]MEA9817868.1 hypothetical protein [Xanthomonas campestris pv. raphani]MEA9911113.1 hypothetical protein [Xanthomonas campestris pv. raphani]MEA9927414.1 hypothetical protein [Xanthomonas campestris pv. raphani]